MISKNSKFAVVKKGNREVGMIGEHRLKEMLNRQSIDNTQESKDSSFLENVQRKFQNWRGRNGVDESKDSLVDISNQSNNRISKDKFGNELSRISMRADQTTPFDSLERQDIESIDVRANNTSIMRTEASEQEHKDREEYKEMVELDNKSAAMGGGGNQNRLAQSERVTSKRSMSKSSTYFNYLNNRMSVRIKYSNGSRDKSLAKRLLGSYGDKHSRHDNDD